MELDSDRYGFQAEESEGYLANKSTKSGDDIKTVQSNFGHATASFTLDVYGHVSQKMRQQSADRMEQFIQGLPVPVRL